MASLRRSGGGVGAAGGWSAAEVRGFVALLALLQVLQGMVDRVPAGNVQFTESYYLVTYRHGFVRRGLLGEGLHLLFGVPTRGEVDITADVVVALAIGAVLVLAELLIRRGSSGSYAMAVLVVATPFTIDFLLIDRRPDLLGVVLLVGLGVVLVGASRAVLAWMVAFGLGFALLVLVHEDVVLVQVPWALVLVAVATLGPDGKAVGGRPGLGRTLAARLGAVAAPPLVATVALLAYGMPSTGRVRALESDVGGYHFVGNTVFTYLANSIGTAADQVGAIPGSAKADTLVLGVILVTLQVAWIVWWVRPQLWATFSRPGNQGLGIGLAATVTLTTAFLFATGFDWVRWFAECGASWLVVQAFTVLSAPPTALGVDRVPKAPSTGRVHLSHWLPALAVYLAVVPPLDVLFITNQLRHFLLGV